MLLSTSLFLFYYPSTFLLHACSMLLPFQLCPDLPSPPICSPSSTLLSLLFFPQWDDSLYVFCLHTVVYVGF